MKTCPFCAEEIQEAAIVCRFCRADLVTKTPGGQSVVIGLQPAWSPGVAAVLSLIIPGAGQMYKGQVFNGITWLFVVVFGYFMFIVPGLLLHLFCVIGAATGTPSQIRVAADATLDESPSSPPAPTMGGRQQIALIIVALGIFAFLMNRAFAPSTSVTGNPGADEVIRSSETSLAERVMLAADEPRRAITLRNLVVADSLPCDRVVRVFEKVSESKAFAWGVACAAGQSYFVRITSVVDGQSLSSVMTCREYESLASGDCFTK